MSTPLPRGRKLALGTLVIELALALMLTLPSLGLFALILMPIVGIAWLPAAGLMLSDLRDAPDPRTVGYALAAVSALAGLSCLTLVARWTLAGMLA